MSELLSASGLTVGYGDVGVAREINLEVGPGEVVALLGPNGAGKTTTMLTLAGELPQLAGDVRVIGESTRAPLHRRVGRGLAFVPEERSVFMSLTTKQNLRVAGCDIARVLEMVPELEPLLGRRAGLLSGGEQQLLTLGRALNRQGTRLLLADELSMGLAPRAAARLLREVRAAADRGMGALIVEQHVHRALTVADRVLVLARGRVRFSGTADEARGRLKEIQGLYLSTSEGADDVGS